LTGDPGGAPMRCGVSVVDFSGGILAMLALTIGLHRAQRTGLGSEIDVSLYDTALSMLNYLAAWQLNLGFHPERTRDSAHQTIVPAQTFRTADGYVVVMCMKEKFWQRLCERIDRGDLAADPRFATFADRYARRDELVALLGAEMAKRSTVEWLDRLRGAVPCAPVYSVEEALADEQTLARDMVVSLEHPALGTLREVGTPIKIDGALPRLRPAPALGAHSEEILARLGGYSPEEIAALRGRGVI